MSASGGIIKSTRLSLCLLAAVLLPLSTAKSAELTGRFSMLGATARAEPGDIGYIDADNDTLTADQQSLRLMLDSTGSDDEWSLHVRMARQGSSGYPADSLHSSDLFRYRELSGNWLDESSGTTSVRAGYELDRAVYKRRFGDIGIGVGRQPIDWGSGRFWQPLNVFGAFAPTDLDTDFKPGIDGMTLDWYPSAFSSLTAAYVLAPRDDAAIDNSKAAYYRRKVGETSEMAWLAGRVIGNDIVGASLEGDWAGMGWRVEGAHYRLESTGENSAFWIAGVDRQFGNGVLVTAEWYNNSRGANTTNALAGMQTDPLVLYGLQPYLGRRVLGVSAARDITPLWHGNYLLLISALKDADGQLGTSLLHQFSFSYSVSNESDLLFALLLANGKGLNALNEPQSEFGHLPASVTVRLRFYF